MHRPPALVVAGAAALALVLAGCSQGGTYTPDDQARTEQQLVPRTPGPLPSDQGLQTPPLVGTSTGASALPSGAAEADR